MAKLVQNVYGEALFELAKEENKLDDFFEEAKVLLTSMEENPQLISLMTHPEVPMEEKDETLDAIFKGRISDEILGLLHMVLEKGHFAQAEEIFQFFIHCVKEEKGIGEAFVTTPMELSSAEKDKIEKKLLESTSYSSLEIHYGLDASLLGGMVIRIGDRVVDSSISTKLRSLTREMSKIQLKAGESTP